MNSLEPEIWVNKYADILYRFAYRRTGSHDLSKDLVQDTFLAALQNYDTYKGELSEKNWLFLILKRKIIDNYRKNFTGKFISLDIADENNFFEENGRWKKDCIPELWTDEMTSNIENNELLGIIDKCVNKLNEIQKSVFIMKYIDNEESGLICSELEISPGNLWVILHRARLNVRKCVDNLLKIKVE